MSNTNGRIVVSGTVLVIAVTCLVLGTFALVVVLAVAIPDGGNAGSLIALLLGQLTATLPSLFALAKISNTAAQVDQLSNGLMDAKIRAGVADVIGPEAVHHEARDQVEVDRARRRDLDTAAGLHVATRPRRP